MSSLTVVLQPADCARQSVQFLYAHSPAVDTACAAAAAACRLLSEVVQTFQYNGIPFQSYVHVDSLLRQLPNLDQ